MEKKTYKICLNKQTSMGDLSKVNNLKFKSDSKLIELKTENICNTKKSNKLKTTIEKIFEGLREIKCFFEKTDNEELELKTEWIINELTSNKLYNFAENEEFNKKFLKIYSPDNDFEEDLKEVRSNSHDVFDSQKDTSMKTKNKDSAKKMVGFNVDNVKENSEDNQDELFKRKVKKQASIIMENKILKSLSYKEFGVNFDVFAYSEEIGRIFMLKQVFMASLAYRNVYNLIKTSYVDNFIEGLRLGYTKEITAYYHNVCFN